VKAKFFEVVPQNFGHHLGEENLKILVNCKSRIKWLVTCVTTLK